MTGYYEFWKLGSRWITSALRGSPRSRGSSTSDEGGGHVSRSKHCKSFSRVTRREESGRRGEQSICRVLGAEGTECKEMIAHGWDSKLSVPTECMLAADQQFKSIKQGGLGAVFTSDPRTHTWPFHQDCDCDAVSSLPLVVRQSQSRSGACNPERQTNQGRRSVGSAPLWRCTLY
jgi:hypothetical protein